MSWSVNAKGTPAECKAQLAEQFRAPLAEGSGLADLGERETVRRISETLGQILETFDPEQTTNPVIVAAYGHMGWSDYDTKKGAYQSVNLEIHLTQ